MFSLMFNFSSSSYNRLHVLMHMMDQVNKHFLHELSEIKVGIAYEGKAPCICFRSTAIFGSFGSKLLILLKVEPSFLLYSLDI